MNFDIIQHPELFCIENINSLRNPQNKFVENLQDYINVVTELDVSFKKTAFFLKEIFVEGLPWSEPHEKILSNQEFYFLRSQLTNIFDKYGKFEETSNLKTSDSIPELDFFNQELLKETKKLITFAKKNEKNYFFSNDDIEYKFFYKGEKLNIKSIRPNKLYEEIVSYESWLPRNKNDFDKKIRECIEISMKKSGKKRIDTYTYTFHRGFKKSFLNSNILYKNRIVDRIGRRLSKTEKEAIEDPLLEEEDIPGLGIRRMRVWEKPKSLRIHFNYIDKNKNNIFFKSFDTQHDKSLKKR